MTYNHARFIAKALDSILMQKTNFLFEILISEDNSTDGTREIVEAYHKKYPEKIRLLLSEKNIHTNEVVSRGIHAAKGNYIALLDGDDFWTSEHKLQLQADYLDKNAKCVLCFHNAQVFYEEATQSTRNWTSANQKQVSTLDDLWRGNFIATCSTMFRNGILEKVPKWYHSFFPITDWPLYILLAEHGTIDYIGEVMGVYRQHSGGLYSPYDEKEKQKITLALYKKINRCLNFRYSKAITTAASVYFYEWAEEYKKRGNIKRAVECFNVYLTNWPVNKTISVKKAIRFGFGLYSSYIVNAFSKN